MVGSPVDSWWSWWIVRPSGITSGVGSPVDSRIGGWVPGSASDTLAASGLSLLMRWT